MMTDEESNERIRLMIIGVVIVFGLHLLIGVILSAQTITTEQITLSYWSAVAIDLIGIGIIAVMGVFA